MIRKYNLSQFPNAKRDVFISKDTLDKPGPGDYNPAKLQNSAKGAIRYKPVGVVNLKED